MRVFTIGWVWKGGLLVLWLTSIAIGLFLLVDYKNTPGASASAPCDWPTDSALTRAEDRPTLVLYLHPHCDCSFATVEQLKQLLAEVPSKPLTYVLFLCPSAVSEDWCRSSLFERATAIPGVNVLLDHDERERRCFGALTSGQVLLYDNRGRLRYNGGITRARGVDGDNFGRRAVVRLLNGAGGDASPSPVLGCPLVSEGDCGCRP